MQAVLLSLLLLRPLGKAEGLQVSYPAQTVERALKALSAETGEKMVAGEEVASEIVVIRSENASISEIRERLARVIGAEWSKVGGDWRLTRPASLDSKQRGEELNARAKAMAAVIRERVAKQEPFTLGGAQAAASLTALATDQYEKRMQTNPQTTLAQMRAANRLSPASRTLLKLLSRIDPAVLASVRLGENVIFAMKPTPVQKALPSGCQDLIYDFNREQKFWLMALDNEPPIRENVSGLDPRYGVDKSLGEGTRLVLDLRRPVGGDYVGATLRVVNKDGWIVARSTDAIESTMSADPPKLLAQAEGSPLPPPADATDYVNFYSLKYGYAGDLGRSTDMAALDKRVLPRLLHPEDFEPLNFTVGELIAEVAKAKHANLIALLPDDLLNWNRVSNTGEKFTPNGWLLKLAQSSHVVVGEDGWLTIRPQFMAASRDERLDRNELGRFAREVAEKKWMTLDDVAAYSHRQKSPQCLLVYDELLARLGDNPEGSYPVNDVAAIWKRMELRVFGALTQGQRDTLRRGGRVTVADMSGEARERMRQFLYSWHWTSDGTPDFPAPVPPAGFEYLLGHISRETTEVFPRGLPMDAALVGTPQRQDVVRAPISQLTPGRDIALVGSDLGSWGDMGPNLGEAGVDKDGFTKCRLGHAMLLGVEFRFDATHTIHTEFGEVEKDGWSPMMNVSDLPRSLIDAAIEARRRDMKAAADREAAERKTGTKPPQ